MTNSVQTVFTAVDKMTAPIRRMERGMTRFTASARSGINGLNRGLKSITPGLNGMAKQMAVFGTGAAVFGAFTYGAKAVADFDQANADLAGKLNLARNSKDMQLMRQSAIDLGGSTVRTATDVSKLQFALGGLGFKTPEILQMSKAVIDGSIAMRSNLESTAKSVGAVILSFDQFKASRVDAFGNVVEGDAQEVVDKMVVGANLSAMDFETYSTAIGLVAGAANAAGVPFDNLLALMGQLKNAGIDTSMAANSLKNIFINAEKMGLNYEQILKLIEKEEHKLSKAEDYVQRRASVSGAILSDKIEETEKLVKEINKASKGNEYYGRSAKIAAEMQNTFWNSLQMLKSKFEELSIKADESTGILNKFKKMIQYTTDNLETVLSTILWIIGTFVALKAIVLANAVVTGIYSAYLGGLALYMGGATAAIRANTIANGIYTIGTGIASAATWTFAGAAAALGIPIWALILAIIALVAIIYYAIKHWEEWGSLLLMLMGPLGVIINIITMIVKRWDELKAAFKDGGLIGFFSKLGLVITDALLYPLEQLMNYIEMIPGLDNLGWADGVREMRSKLDLETMETKNPKYSDIDAISSGRSRNSNLNISMKDPGGLLNYDLNSHKDDGIKLVSSVTGGL